MRTYSHPYTLVGMVVVVAAVVYKCQKCPLEVPASVLVAFNFIKYISAKTSRVRLQDNIVYLI